MAVVKKLVGDSSTEEPGIAPYDLSNRNVSFRQKSPFVEPSKAKDQEPKSGHTGKFEHKKIPSVHERPRRGSTHKYREHCRSSKNGRRRELGYTPSSEANNQFLFVSEKRKRNSLNRDDALCLVLAGSRPGNSKRAF